jgi:hypothetical protein
MELTVVIGNGESRIGFDLSKLDGHITYGCNALYRDYNPTYLVACDRLMVEEIVDRGKAVYTRDKWKNDFKDYPFVKYLPRLPYSGQLRADQEDNWGTGMYAAYLASLKRPKKTYLLGFDHHITTVRVNNVYKGTNCYIPKETKAVNTSYWTYQLGHLRGIYPDIDYVHVTDHNILLEACHMRA